MAFDPPGGSSSRRGHWLRAPYANGTLQASPVITFSVDTCGERGLWGMAIDPDFNTNHYIYTAYSEYSGCVGTLDKVVRFVENNGVGSDPVTIYSWSTGSPIHNGGNLHFGPDGKLYVSVGDAGNWFFAQDLTVPQGKIHRFNPDGTIPPDNPVFTQTGALPSLYARGLRNSFDLTFDPLLPGSIFASENGPKSSSRSFVRLSVSQAMRSSPGQ